MLRGLKPAAVGEVNRLLGRNAVIRPSSDDESISLECRGALGGLLNLRTVVAAYLVLPFAIPRPLALLGDMHFRRLTGAIERVRVLHPAGAFRTFVVGAAGRDSPTILRLRSAIFAATGLTDEEKAGDLQIRLRRGLAGADGSVVWEVLIRLSPRPLATRYWRTYNLPGAVNATIAAALADLGAPRPNGRYLNLYCGSATILIERLLQGPARVAFGVDLDPLALQHAEEHVRAAGLDREAQVVEMDATSLNFPDGSFDSIAADLPWGQLTGSHRQNASLYPAALAEARRVAAPGARLVLLTHEVALIERVLADFAGAWSIRDVIRIFQGGLHPRIYLLDRVD